VAEHAKFPVEVMTPEGPAFTDEVQMVSTRTTVGSIGLLAGHAPLLAMLDPCELRMYRSESEIVRFAQSEGYIQVASGRALLLVEEAVPVESLNGAELREQLSRAERELEQAGEDSEKRRVAAREKRRLETFLRIAQGS
jgi:F-type H+-transporting ATPase subunit epsilon